MSSVKVQLSGDTDALLQRLNHMKNSDIRGALNAIAEGLRTSTVERFTTEKAPDGDRWAKSDRVIEEGGKTLTKTAQLKTSIHSETSEKGLAVGTNDIRAATHQFGDERTIKAKDSKYLTFKMGGQWSKVTAVTIHIPSREFLGISDEDNRDIKDTLESLFEE